ncbi:hypothetical protein PM082_002388 [Marasmius tenuissimus]|nr:hypothetical protein PM082_002388 [Marasmius tenuissimus]
MSAEAYRHRFTVPGRLIWAGRIGESFFVVLRLTAPENMKISERTCTLGRPAGFIRSRLPAFGLAMNLPLMFCISVGSHSGSVIEFLEENAHSSTPCTEIFVNGVWIGAGHSRERAVAAYGRWTG